MLIRNFMTPDPVTVQPETPVEDIAKLLLAHRINGVPVVDGVGRLLGVVTAEDLIHRGADERLEPRESVWKENFWVSFLGPKGAQRDKAEGRTAAEVMTTEVAHRRACHASLRGSPVDGGSSLYVPSRSGRWESDRRHLPD